ncbi:DUF6502 family protein [Aestuariibius sp. 2305UL40-4]|uniref:DUF6502 family protein n=1 Tax=Aestuariibius violaceus TaxID=3234132 RepID=UPI00345E1A5A
MILDRLLVPVAKLFLSLRVPFPQAAEMLKRAYIDAAGRDLTDSRLSLLTGLQRRDIGRLRSEPVREDRPDPLARIVARWVADHDGAPLLRRGPAPSFDSLAASVFKDVHPKSLLDQLVEAGTAALADTGEITLLRRFHKPETGSDEQRDYLARNVGDHLLAAIANLEAEKPPFFERAVHYNRLSAASIARLEGRYRERQAQLLEEINTLAAELQNADLADDARHIGRFRAGGYFYSEDQK